MKKWMALLLLPLLADAQMKITANERVSAMLKPDVLRGSVSFEEQGKTHNTIKENLNAIVAEMKRIDPAGKQCRGGGYQLSPRYSYQDQKQEFIGYSGTLAFECAFASIEDYNAMSRAIERVMGANVRKNQGRLSWGVSEERERETQNRLRVEILRTAEAQSRVFSKETGMRCAVASVNFGVASPMVPMMVKGVAMMESLPTESPIQSDTETSLEAIVDYGCSKRVP